MPAAHIQTNFGVSGAAGVSTSVTMTLGAGNHVIAHLLLSTDTSQAQTVGPTLTQQVSSTHTGGAFIQYTCATGAGGSTTFTFTHTAQLGTLWITEVSGLTNGVVDQSATGPGETAFTHSSGTTGNTTQNDEFAIVVLHGNAGGSSSQTGWSNSFTVPSNGDAMSAGSTHVISCLATRILTSTGAYESTITTGDSQSAKGMIGTYKTSTPITGLRPAICL